jgi:hypothetical protein
MANADAAFGFRPVQMLDGSPYNGQLVIPSSLTPMKALSQYRL